jgi:hypothetical protein
MAEEIFSVNLNAVRDLSTRIERTAHSLNTSRPSPPERPLLPGADVADTALLDHAIEDFDRLVDAMLRWAVAARTSVDTIARNEQDSADRLGTS